MTPQAHAQHLLELADTFDYLSASLTHLGFNSSDECSTAKDAAASARAAAEEINASP